LFITDIFSKKWTHITKESGSVWRKYLKNKMQKRTGAYARDFIVN